MATARGATTTRSSAKRSTGTRRVQTRPRPANATPRAEASVEVRTKPTRRATQLDPRTLAYAYVVGLFQQSFVAATYDLMNWGAPLLFGLHIALEWRRFPRLRSVLTLVFRRSCRG